MPEINDCSDEKHLIKLKEPNVNIEAISQSKSEIQIKNIASEYANELAARRYLYKKSKHSRSSNIGRLQSHHRILKLFEKKNKL